MRVHTVILLYSHISGKKSQTYLAFSAYTNGKQLLSYKKSKSPDQMGCLHGIRVLSTLWVVLGRIDSLKIY